MDPQQTLKYDGECKESPLLLAQPLSKATTSCPAILQMRPELESAGKIGCTSYLPICRKASLQGLHF